MTTEKFGWFYLATAFFILGFSIFLAFSKYGNIKFGKDDDQPQYTNISWFAMLFSAGMGIGLVFWGIAEPLQHYLNPPLGIEGGTTEAAHLAMRYSFFHWGFHAWAVYALIGLCLAYFKFRKGSRGLISSAFYPLLQEKVDGPLGKTIDVLAIIATAFGVATSLGFGALQVNGGLHKVFGISNELKIQIIIIAAVTVLYLISATTGLDKGIKILSNLNIIIAGGFMLFVLLLGPTSFIFDLFTVTLGEYLQNIIQMSFSLTPFTQGTWVADWTLFYWAWWISWAPFVGTFIARISKGRTIKEFILGVILVPSLVCFSWFAVFGGTALNFEIFNNAGLARAAELDVTTTLFLALNHLPLGTITSTVAIILIITFFITSADSATFVLGMFSTNGNLNPKVWVKIIWGILQSSIAIILLYSGGLDGLQTMAIVTALPFAVVLLFMCASIVKALKQEL
jgi:glycine betaine transporter